MLRNYNPFLGDENIKWKHQYYDYTSGDLDYRGASLVHKASTSEGNLWWVWKFTWDTASPPHMIEMEGPFPLNWDERADYNWRV